MVMPSARAWGVALLVPLLLAAAARAAGPIRAVAVAGASNLVHVLPALEEGFARAAPGVRVTTTVGASGGLFAQIRNGAPFDVFLSADLDYPRQLVEAGQAEAASFRTFATGVLALWTLRDDLDLSGALAALRSPAVRTVALAQPRTAPYGRAAERVLERLGPDRSQSFRRVIGESVSQAAQFVETGGAEVGFVALSLLQAPARTPAGRWIIVPAADHAPVTLGHGAVLTRRGAANPDARAFLDFLAGPRARAMLEAHGYLAPP